MRADELVSVYRIGSRPHAEIVAGMLSANGIESQVFSTEFESAAYGPVGSFRVMVRAEDASQARRMIDEVEESPVDE